MLRRDTRRTFMRGMWESRQRLLGILSRMRKHQGRTTKEVMLMPEDDEPRIREEPLAPEDMIHAVLSRLSAEIKANTEDDSANRKELCDVYKQVKEDFALHSEEAAMMAALAIWQERKIGRAIAGLLDAAPVVMKLMDAAQHRHYHREDEYSRE